MEPLTEEAIVRMCATSDQASLISHLRSSSGDATTALILSYIRFYYANKIAVSLKAISLFSAHLADITLLEADVVALVDSLISYLPRVKNSDDGHLLSLLPLLLYRITNKSQVDSAIDKILLADWSRALLIKMVSLIKEFTCVDKVRIKEFVEKVFDKMREAEVQDLPSLVYQLLVLSSTKGFSVVKREVVEGIVMFFGGKRYGRAGGLISRQVEGTVLLHVNFAVKQDPSMALEAMGLLKTDVRAFNHFGIAVLLSVARVKRFSESSIGILKSVMVTVYRDYNMSKKCEWLPEDTVHEYKERVTIVEKAMIKAVNESHYGREHIVPSIVKLAFMLLESVDDELQKEWCCIDGTMGLEKLGIEMLKSLFEVHDMARNEIVDQCKFRILSLKPEQSMPILRLLGKLVQSFPYPMLEQVPRLKELLDYFTFMNGKIATHLVASLLPLIKLSCDLKDYTILVLRKAMFRREESVRVAATKAVFDLLLSENHYRKDCRYSLEESSSQASCSQQPEIICNKGTTLFQELSGLLQRCLYQQAKVKESLYSGLVMLVSEEPSVVATVFDFLLPHFLHFYRQDGDAPLDISCCVKSENGKFCIHEPLDCLVFCISWLLLLQSQGKVKAPSDSSWARLWFSLSQDNEGGRSSPDEILSSAFKNIQKTLISGNIEGILGQTNAGSSRSPEAEKDRCCALILLGIIEVFLNKIAMDLESVSDSEKIDLEKEITVLVDLHSSVVKIVSVPKPCNGVKRGEAQSPGNNVDARNSKASNRKAFLATSSIYQLLQTSLILYEHDSSSTATVCENRSPLTSSRTPLHCHKMISFCLNACVDQLKSCNSMEKDEPQRNLLLGDIKILGTPLLKLVLLLKSRKCQSEQRVKESKGKKDFEDWKDYMHLALNCLMELIRICVSCPDQSGLLDDLSEVAASYFSSEADSNYKEECEKALNIDDQNVRNKELFMVKVVKPLFLELLAMSCFQELEVLCQIISMIGSKLQRKWRDSHGAWTVYICKTSSIKSPKVAKSIVSLGISLNSPPTGLIFVQDLAVELLKILGSKTDTPLEISEEYPVINRWTSSTIAFCILHFIESVVGDLDWVTTKLKTLSVAAQKSTYIVENETQCPVLVLEETIYSQAEAMVKVLSSFVAMRLKDAQAEQLLRLAARFYKQLSRMAKLRIAQKGCKQVLPSRKFQKLVEETCKQLTTPLYSFVELMQKEQQESNIVKGIINKIKRENKCIPDLIFQIEDYEKYLIQLTKITKVNLLRHAKRSLARDFRIVAPEKVNGEEDVTNHPDENNPDAVQDDTREESEGDERCEPERVVSLETDSPLAAEESASDDAAPPSAKRFKTGRVVRDSDED